VGVKKNRIKSDEVASTSRSSYTWTISFNLFLYKMVTDDNKKRKNITSTNINATQNADLYRW
jgi:hypothetical protein